MGCNKELVPGAPKKFFPGSKRKALTPFELFMCPQNLLFAIAGMLKAFAGRTRNV